jgi:arginyl-tRNA synthetase
MLRDDVTPEIKAGRLYIAKLTFDTLAKTIDLMGLQIPNEM